MTRLTTLQQQQTAQANLDELRADLPRFHSLLTDNEQEAERLRREKAPLDDQAQARGRVNVAREMLEQHQADISSAQAEVDRLEAAIDREDTLGRMVELSKTAKAERERIDKALARVTRELQRATLTITEAWTAENEARRGFADAGSKLMPHFRDTSHPGDAGLARIAVFEQELKEHGVELEAVKDGATGTFCCLDRYIVKAFSRDAVSVLLWEAIRQLSRDDKQAHNLRRLSPSRPNPSESFPLLPPDLPKGI